MRSIASLTALVVLFLACASSPPPGRTPSGGYTSCTSDADCVVTTFGGCCACCPDTPRAVPASKLEAQRTSCARADCATCSDRIDCPKTEPVSAFVARCQDGTCAALRK
jgi:hypothetical protein